MLVSLLPEYDKLARAYQSPIHLELATPEDLTRYREWADRAVTGLAGVGFVLSGEIGDLRLLDEALGQVFSSGELVLDSAAQSAIGNDVELFLIGLGLHLGFVCQSMTEGTWYRHSSMHGVSIRGPLLNPFYPIQRVFEQAKLGPNAGPLNCLAAFESAFVCAKLVRQLERSEISRREEVTKLLTEALPSLLLDDPSGESIDRLVDMICINAGSGVQ